MKKIVIGLFAHPDDEAFGVSPTLIKEVAEGAEVHLITLTAGENGTNPDNHADLGAVRLEEWRRGGEIIGARSMHHFGYTDGTLCNADIHPIAERLHAIVTPLIEATTDEHIEFMSFDFGGISGHIDHIVAARAAALAFYRLKERYPDRVSKLRLRCLSASQLPTHNIDWLYMEAGQDDALINETIDATRYRDTVARVIRTHYSQRHDGETHIARYGDSLAINYFIVKE